MRTALRSLLLAASMGAGALAGCAAPAAQAPVDAPRVAPRPDPDPIVAPAPAVDRARVRAALAARREVAVARFLAYREARVYPLNTHVDGAQHVWLDAFGNLCAAATIIAGDWGLDPVGRVAVEDNFVRLADVHDGPLHDWILTSGLTHHEIVAIQVPPMGREWRPEPEQPRPGWEPDEVARLYQIYVDVERQLATMRDASLDAATDALMARPDLARGLIDGVAAGPGRFGEPALASPGDGIGFAQPPPG